MSKQSTASPTRDKSEGLPALPPRRARRRSTRPSQSWCFRTPPSRKRVAVASARGLPEPVATPPQPRDLQPANDSQH